MHFGKELARFRGVRGLTQLDLAGSSQLSFAAVRAAELHPKKGMYPRSFMALAYGLASVTPLSKEEIATFAAWSGIEPSLFEAENHRASRIKARHIGSNELPAFQPVLLNAIAAALYRMSQTELADVIDSVTRALVNAQADHPLPPDQRQPTTITGPGLLGLKHPEHSGYQVTVYFEPAKPAEPGKQPPQTKPRKRA
jgi:hypothetical protein